MPLPEMIVAAFGAAFLLILIGPRRGPKRTAVSGLVYSAVALYGLGVSLSTTFAIYALATGFTARWLALQVTKVESGEEPVMTSVSQLRSRVPRL